MIAADDALVEDAVENVINHLKNNSNVELLFTQVEIYMEEFSPENSLGIQPSNSNQISLYSSTVTPEMQLEYLLKGGGYHYAPGFFTKKSIFSEVGFYDEVYTMTEDVPFFLKLALNGKKVCYAPVLTAKYRKHNSNYTNRGDFVLPRYMLQIYTVVYDASKKYGKRKFIITNYWHKAIVKAIFFFGNQGVFCSVLDWFRLSFQPIRFYNLINKLQHKKSAVGFRL